MSSHGNTQNVRNVVSQSVALRSDSIKMHKNAKKNLYPTLLTDFSFMVSNAFGELGVYIKYKSHVSHGKTL